MPAKKASPARARVRPSPSLQTIANRPSRVVTLDSGIKVYCRHDELADLTSLVRFPRNPNVHPPEQLRLLAKIITQQGWRNPIVVSTRSGFITKGHGRLSAAELIAAERGEYSVPVEYQDYVSEASEYADIIADNRIAELAEMDETIVADLARDVRGSDDSFDFEMFGYAPDLTSDWFSPDATGSGDADGDADADDDGGRYSAEDLQRFDAYFAGGQQITLQAQRGETWRVGDHYFYVGSVLWGHSSYVPLLAALATEFPTRRVALVPLPEPMMLGTRSRRVAAVFLQPDLVAASLTLSFAQQCYSHLTIERVAEGGAS